MMTRPDISPNLIHFTSPGDDWEKAYSRLKSILADRQLVAGNGKIKGGHYCVCFSEAPFLSVDGGLVNESGYSRYAPFGILLTKQSVFDRGGRPVIYEPDSEYKLLPESIQWRHVRYQPTGAVQVDFSWEREWRVPCSSFPIHPNEIAVVVPQLEWADRLVQDHDLEQDSQVQMYAMAIGEFIAEQYREDFPWRILALGE